MSNRSKLSRAVSSWTCLPLVIALLVQSVDAHAQGQRDPTIPPASSGLSGASGEALAPTLDASPTTVIVRNGRPYLVIGTRLVAQGQKLGDARIERIGETEIWLREGGQLRKVPRFAGVQRRSSHP